MYLKNKLWNISRLVSSLYFSIMLFLFLAFVSILGTIIEQDQSLNYYQLHYSDTSPVFFFITWKRILLFGLDHMYSTYWFYSILILFFLSLLVCTLSTQLPILKYSRQWNFLYSQAALEKKTCLYKFQPTSLLNLVYLLNLNNYFVFHKGKAIYSYKGLSGRVAPIFVHASIIISFIGFILRMTSGLVVQEIVPSGEIFHLQNMVVSGYLSSLPSGTVGKVNDFFISFNKNTSIKQFFSNVSFIDNNKDVIVAKYIWVNSPMKFRGLTIYQTDWQINALRIEVGLDKSIVKNLKEVKPNTSEDNIAWCCDFYVDKDHQISIVVPTLLNNLFIYDKQGQFILSANYGEWVILYGTPILFKDLMVSTGLQIKVDPGLYISYFGFAILIFSIIASYLSYSQIWASQNTLIQITFSGETNRALLSFEDELFNIAKKIKSL